MAESEERPSKIRKLNSPDESNEPLQGDSPSMGLSASQADHDEEDSKVNQVPSTTNDPPLSRNQLKKLRKREQWEAGKDYRKDKRRALHKEKQARKAEARREMNEKIAKGEIERPVVKQKGGPRRPIQTPVAFVLDCDFDELMTEKEIISLSAQITRCYSDNKSTPYRVHLAISSWGGVLKSRFENVLASNHLSWKGVKFYEGDFVAAGKDLDGIMRGRDGGRLVGALAPSTEEPKVTGVPALVPDALPVTSLTESEETLRDTKSFEPETATEAAASTIEAEIKAELITAVGVSELEAEVKPDQVLGDEGREVEAKKPEPSIVYLTADSDDTLSVLSPNTTYIIGGIVDKNRHKGICYKRAAERGIKTARLPIGEYMTMQSRSVLAVNHVFEIMLAWMETGDWGEAFLKVIPKRKEAKLRTNGRAQSATGGKVGKRGEGQSEDEESGGSEDESQSNDADGHEAASGKANIASPAQILES
ncbi:tRNA (guanine(9)-N(1))-methyltransferase [Cadophora gregata]|uniref:tRNA (guanine(9)-N(1))-methyltransferase n=1 Tax=Cadophora gregata TaxID=51156 RepID=UPI0026DBEA2E|nr:tRNA (guanine(9)-N(1))-methyltransferase [Cadophora gregata]KAK0113718.1 tRNA (guanine(9)-N(1))-methyltransferase [Cadophora gregata f. sp. sojae]KAK0114475.1 tRNA (guanine(9)-N(1))-methyltransferase [Cadophora gregata]